MTAGRRGWPQQSAFLRTRAGLTRSCGLKAGWNDLVTRSARGPVPIRERAPCVRAWPRSCSGLSEMTVRAWVAEGVLPVADTKLAPPPARRRTRPRRAPPRQRPPSDRRDREAWTRCPAAGRRRPARPRRSGRVARADAAGRRRRYRRGDAAPACRTRSRPPPCPAVDRRAPRPPPQDLRRLSCPDWPSTAAGQLPTA